MFIRLSLFNSTQDLVKKFDAPTKKEWQEVLSMLKKAVNDEKLETKDLVDVQIKTAKHFEKYNIEITSKDGNSTVVKLKGEDDEEEDEYFLGDVDEEIGQQQISVRTFKK